MNYPDIGLDVVVILDTGEEKIGYWDGSIWMQGVENDSNDAELVGNVINWRTNS